MPAVLSQPRSAPGAATDLTPQERPTAEGPWATAVHNDPVNLMSYVVYVFRRHFAYSRPVAEALMTQVHEKGRAIVSRGSRERMETDVQAMHSYGLRATLERAGED
ncbi:ATP-dependent Clp protease adapter ClpS [Brachybacterium horti]